MPSRKTDVNLTNRGGVHYQDSNLNLVRGSLLASLESGGLLPTGTLSQATPPADTSVYWIDEATDPETLKYNNGSGWVAATFEKLYLQGFQNSQTFSASGTFTVPCENVYVEVYGGGGGGSGGRDSFVAVSSWNGTGGGGGGQGGIAKKLVTGLTIGDSISVIVGLGGAGSQVSVSNSATAGTSSSFDGSVVATGGGGGSYLFGGFGGSGAGGDVNFRGEGGQHSFFIGGATQKWQGGGGGAGGVRQGSGVDANGNNSSTIGGGGGGATRTSAQVDTLGGSGSDGMVVVYW